MEARRRNRGKTGRGRQNAEKITWFDIYSDFKRRFPTMSKDAPDFQPHSYATIKLYFTDGRRMLYNYDTKKMTDLG